MGKSECMHHHSPFILPNTNSNRECLVLNKLGIKGFINLYILCDNSEHPC